MTIRGPAFPTPLADAPTWVRSGIDRFEQLQRQTSRDLGEHPATNLRDGERVYFPNAVLHWHIGMIGTVVALCGFVGALTVVLTGAVFMGGVPTGAWVALGLFVVLGIASLAVTAKKSLERGTLRRNGMYLLPEGAAFVRNEMCSWATRGAIEGFELTSSVGAETGSSSYREALRLRNGDAVVLAAGKHPLLRDVAEAWRERRPLPKP